MIRRGHLLCKIILQQGQGRLFRGHRRIQVLVICAGWWSVLGNHAAIGIQKIGHGGGGRGRNPPVVAVPRNLVNSAVWPGVAELKIL